MKEDNNSMHRTRHLILIIVSVLVMTMMGLTCHAENSQGQRPPFDPKRFEAELEQYITTHASLTPQEASKFFPVYRQMMNKMYLLLPLDADEPHVSLKCSTDYTEELRDRYQAVTPAFHFNKKYWNSIYLERDMEEAEIKRWIHHSYREVIAKLPKSLREEYKENP
jgi:predicted DNA-binding protein (MmcQ/YjbR family)